MSRGVLKQCVDYYHASLHLLREVDGPCITHRDFRLGNLIVHQGKLRGIIDWSSARSSFAEEDLGVLLAEWVGDESKNSFLSGYASIRLVPNYERMMSLLCLSKAIAAIGFTIKSKTWNNKNVAFYQRHLGFLHQFLLSIR